MTSTVCDLLKCVCVCVCVWVGGCVREACGCLRVRGPYVLTKSFGHLLFKTTIIVVLVNDQPFFNSTVSFCFLFQHSSRVALSKYAWNVEEAIESLFNS